MAYETVTVRMNRSKSTIPWGFVVDCGDTMPIKISNVQKGSLADKAGIQVNDMVTEFCGRTTKRMSLQEAKNIVEGDSLEIYMLLQRHVTEHSCLPWQLTEKNNQITVDHIKPQPVNYNYYKSERKDISHSKSNYEVPIMNDSSKYRTSSYSKHEENSSNRPLSFDCQPNVAPFTNVTNTDFQDAQDKRTQNKYNTDSYRAESRSMDEYGFDRKPTSGVLRNVPITLKTPSSAPLKTPGSDMKTAPEGKIYGPVHVDTSNAHNVGYSLSSSAGGHRPARNASTKPIWQDAGPRIPFQHSPRTERQLSPHATVRHLQYNSPMNLYSPHSAAEQYIQQTGGFFGTDPSLQRSKGEAYLKSETRRLIAEEEKGHSTHEKSPSTQSASFKRISRACGTPVD